MFEHPKKILIVKICCIGDIVFSLPLLETIKTNLPETKIAYLVNKWCKGLIDNIEEVDTSIIFDSAFDKVSLKKFIEIYKLIKNLRLEKFDIAINLHRNKIFGLIFWLSGIKTRIGFGKSLFYNKYAEFKETLPERERILELIKYFKFKEYFNIPRINLGEEKVQKVLKDLEKYGLQFNKKAIAVFPDGGVNPGSTMQMKQLDIGKMIQFLKKVLDSYDFQIFLVSSREENGSAEKIFQNLMKNKNVALVPLLPKMDIQYVFKYCEAVIGGDTGMLHLAAAVGVPVLMFFGPSDPRLVAPPGDKHKILWHQIDCAPCYTPRSVMDKNNFIKGAFICKRGDVKCMELITVDEIFDAFKQIINNGKK